jgi:hypothetical protein
VTPVGGSDGEKEAKGEKAGLKGEKCLKSRAGHVKVQEANDEMHTKKDRWGRSNTL